MNSLSAPPTSYSNLDGKRILVAGAGVTGRAVAHELINRGADVTFADENLILDLDIKVLNPKDVDISDFDGLMVSPGWRENHPIVIAAKDAMLPIFNEVDFAWFIKSEIIPSQRWIALTGTNGKTTTVEMLAHILKSAGIKAQACGNVGTTVIESVCSAENFDYLILELSSFQLHWLSDAQFVSVAILNIADDHIDWHGSFDKYANDKISILDKASTGILNGDDGEIVRRTTHWLGRKIFYSLDTPAPGELGIVEELLVDRAFVPDPQEAAFIAELNEIKPTVPHHISNCLAASALSATVGVSHEAIRAALMTFQPGRHRIETVLVKDEITWINDSKATNPHAASASILSNFSVIWIGGGLAKGAQMDLLIDKTWSRLKAAILIGEDRDLIAKAIIRTAPNLPIHLIDPPSDYRKGGSTNIFMESVVRCAHSIAEPGDVVLLAPACASMDQFISYGDRGDRFVRAVKEVVADGK